MTGQRFETRESSPFYGVSASVMAPHIRASSSTNKLYHYTNAAGLRGILTSRKLWLTDTRFMNDRSEGNYGLVLTQSVVRHMTENMDDHESLFAERLIDRLPMVAGIQSTAACSFCEKPDLLTQWRAYGNDQVSYCIEFDASLLRGPGYNFKAEMLKVIYDEAEQIRLIEEVGGRIYDIAKSMRNMDATDGEVENLISLAAQEVYFPAYWLKHPAFSSEEEWRLTLEINVIKQVNADTHVRAGRWGFVPYFEWGKEDKSDLPITGIMIGPTEDPSLAVRGLGALLESLKYAPELVQPPSRIPLRAL